MDLILSPPNNRVGQAILLARKRVACQIQLVASGYVLTRVQDHNL
jgi:hypothetical protein